MPIPKNAVKGEPIEDFKERVLATLKKDQTQAYSLTEIVKEVTGVTYPYGLGYELVVIALETLLTNKEVSGAVVGQEVYFMARN